jgi:hypothetical protein
MRVHQTRAGSAPIHTIINYNALQKTLLTILADVAFVVVEGAAKHLPAFALWNLVFTP